MSSKTVAKDKDASTNEKIPDIQATISRTGYVRIVGGTSIPNEGNEMDQTKHSIRSAVAALRGHAMRQLRLKQETESQQEEKDLHNFSFGSPNRLSQYQS